MQGQGIGRQEVFYKIVNAVSDTEVDVINFFESSATPKRPLPCRDFISVFGTVTQGDFLEKLYFKLKGHIFLWTLKGLHAHGKDRHPGTFDKLFFSQKSYVFVMQMKFYIRTYLFAPQADFFSRFVGSYMNTYAPDALKTFLVSFAAHE